MPATAAARSRPKEQIEGHRTLQAAEGVAQKKTGAVRSRSVNCECAQLLPGDWGGCPQTVGLSYCSGDSTRTTIRPLCFSADTMMSPGRTNFWRSRRRGDRRWTRRFGRSSLFFGSCSTLNPLAAWSLVDRWQIVGPRVFGAPWRPSVKGFYTSRTSATLTYSCTIRDS